MITIIYSTHKDKEYNDKFNDHLVLTSGLQWVQVLPYVNHNEYSLSELYNKGIKESKYDIVVCCHNDIKLEKNWGKKLLEDFSNNPDYGIIGKAGSCYFPESGVYWEKMTQTMVGQVYHQPDGQKKWLSKYSPKLPFLIPVVTIDGLFISFNKQKIKHTFDESYGKFHFYDHGFCVPNYIDGVNIGVTSSFEITHQSVGRPNQEFFESKEKFVEKWKGHLPLDLKPKSLFSIKTTQKQIKNLGKVAVVIVSNNNDNLNNCVKSFINNCDETLYDIYVGDIGLSDELEHENVKYFKYNESNVNIVKNNIVENHVKNEYEHILFCDDSIVLIDNIIINMLKLFKENNKIGTLGCRIHSDDNLVYHDGVVVYLVKNNELVLSNKNLGNYYNYNNNPSNSIGNTGGVLMIKNNIFKKCGMFNTKYNTSLADIELSVQCVIKGLNNICDSNSVVKQNNIVPVDENEFNHILASNLINNYDKLKNFIFNV